MGDPENGNFPLIYVVKMSLRTYLGGWVVQRSLNTPLRNIKMAPNTTTPPLNKQILQRYFCMMTLTTNVSTLSSQNKN